MLVRGSTKALGISETSKGDGRESSSATSGLWRRSTTEVDRQGNFHRLNNLSYKGGQWGHDVAVKAGPRNEGTGVEESIGVEEVDVPIGGIRVKKEIVVTSTDWLEYRERLF